MEESNHVWNIAQAIYMTIGTAAIVKVIIDIIRDFNSEENDIYHPSYPTNPHQDDFENEMFHQGYVFCNVFKTSDIYEISHRMGIALTKPDVIKVIQAIKKDFTISVGIDRHRIEMYIRIIVINRFDE